MSIPDVKARQAFRRAIRSAVRGLRRDVVHPRVADRRSQAPVRRRRLPLDREERKAVGRQGVRPYPAIQQLSVPRYGRLPRFRARRERGFHMARAGHGREGETVAQHISTGGHEGASSRHNRSIGFSGIVRFFTNNLVPMLEQQGTGPFEAEWCPTGTTRRGCSPQEPPRRRRRRGRASPRCPRLQRWSLPEVTAAGV
jgi:hypothetical protein